MTIELWATRGALALVPVLWVGTSLALKPVDCTVQDMGPRERGRQHRGAAQLKLVREHKCDFTGDVASTFVNESAQPPPFC